MHTYPKQASIPTRGSIVIAGAGHALAGTSFTANDSGNSQSLTGANGTKLTLQKNGGEAAAGLTLLSVDGNFTVDSDGDVTVGKDLTVDGDLLVSGDIVTVNVATLTIEDPLIELGSGNGADLVDLGFYANYVDGATKFGGLFRDASDGVWKLFDSLTAEPTTTVTVGSNSYDHADLQIGNLTADDGVDLVDSAELTLGTSEDLKLYHNGTDSYIVNNTGDLIVAGKAGEDFTLGIFNSTATSENGGSLDIRAGAGSNDTEGDGGDIILAAGAAQAGNSDGGNIHLKAGVSAGDGDDGEIQMFTEFVTFKNYADTVTWAGMEWENGTATLAADPDNDTPDEGASFIIVAGDGANGGNEDGGSVGLVAGAESGSGGGGFVVLGSDEAVVFCDQAVDIGASFLGISQGGGSANLKTDPFAAAGTHLNLQASDGASGGGDGGSVILQGGDGGGGGARDGGNARILLGASVGGGTDGLFGVYQNDLTVLFTVGYDGEAAFKGTVDAAAFVGHVVSTTGTKNLTSLECTHLLLDTSGGVGTVNLPAIAAANDGWVLWIKNSDTTAQGNNVTVNRAGGDTIDGATSKTLSALASFCLVADNARSIWWIL